MIKYTKNEHLNWRNSIEMDCTADVSEIRALSIVKDVRNAGKYSTHFQDAMNQTQDQQ